MKVEDLMQLPDGILAGLEENFPTEEEALEFMNKCEREGLSEEKIIAKLDLLTRTNDGEFD